MFSFSFSFLFLNFSIFCQENKFHQKVEWEGDSNAIEYKVEIQSLSQPEDSVFYNTTDTFIEFSMPSGLYQYRVFTYDYLGREASVSEWQKFEIFKARTPLIDVTDKDKTIEKKDNSLEIDADITKITQNSVAVLINQKTGEQIEGEIIIDVYGDADETKASKVLFPKVEEGEWVLKVTNESGLSSQSEIISIKNKEEPVIIAQSEEPKKEEPKKEEPKKEEPKKEESKKEESKKEKPLKQPGRLLDCTVSAGCGMQFYLYDGTLSSYNSMPFTIAPSVLIKYLPFNINDCRMGVDIFAQVSDIKSENDYLKVNLPNGLFTLDFFIKYPLADKKFFLSASAGAGVYLVKKEIRYPEDPENNPDDGYFGSVAVKAGFGIIWTPVDSLEIALSLEYTNAFLKETLTGIISPVISVGWRF